MCSIIYCTMKINNIINKINNDDSYKILYYIIYIQSNIGSIIIDNF